MKEDIKYLEWLKEEISDEGYGKQCKQAIENLINRNKELEAINFSTEEIKRYNKKHFIDKDKIKEILGIEEDITEDKLLSYIQILVDENNRLEDIEDRKVQIEYELVFNKGKKSVEDKIREKIEKIEKYKSTDEVDEFGIHSMNWLLADNMQEILKELLEEGDDK